MTDVSIYNKQFTKEKAKQQLDEISKIICKLDNTKGLTEIKQSNENAPRTYEDILFENFIGLILIKKTFEKTKYDDSRAIKLMFYLAFTAVSMLFSCKFTEQNNNIVQKAKTTIVAKARNFSLEIPSEKCDLHTLSRFGILFIL